MVLIGTRQQDWYVHQSNDGSSFADHMAQSMEHWVKLMKRHLRTNCNSRDGWRKRLMNFMDCFTVGSVGYDLVDFKSCSKRYLKTVEMLYMPTTTHMIETNIILEMPTKFFEIFGKVDAIQFGDPIPNDLSRLWNSHLSKHQQYQAMHVHMNEISAFDQITHNSDWDSDVPGPVNEHLSNKKRVSKTELLQIMQDNYSK